MINQYNPSLEYILNFFALFSMHYDCFAKPLPLSNSTHCLLCLHLGSWINTRLPDCPNPTFHTTARVIFPKSLYLLKAFNDLGCLAVSVGRARGS